MAQKSIQIKYEIGIAHTNYALTNPQNNVQIFNNEHIYYGFSVSHELNYNFHLEAGIYSTFYGADFYSSSPDTTNLILGMDRIQIPFRIIYKKSILSERLYFSLITGGSLLISHSQNGFIISSDTEWQSIGNRPNRTFGLIEFGAGMEYEIFKNVTVGINIRSFYGLNQHINLQYENINSDNSVTNYDIRSNGNFQAYTFALGYKFKEKKK